MMRELMLAAALAVTPALAQERDFSKVEVTSEEAAPGVHVLYGAGGNMALAFGPDGAFLVDDQFAPLTPRIEAKIREIAGQDVRFLVNTHWHFDHTGGNENFGKAGALIVAHDNVRRRLAAGAKNERWDIAPAPPAALPVLTFRDRQSFHMNGDTVRAVHVENAHTDGDAIIYFEGANVIHMGDTFFEAGAGTFPYIDLDSGGSVQGVIAALDTGLKLANAGTKIIPGHGRLTDRAGLAAYRAMLADVTATVQARIDAGATKAEIVAAKPAAAYAEARAGGFVSADDFVGTVYDSLTLPAAHSHADGTRHGK